MVRRLNGRLPWLVACAAVAALALALPAAAQSTGMVRGVVKDAARASPSKARRSSSTPKANNRHFDTKSNKKGEFMQIGLPPGPYKVTAEKDKVVSAPSTVDVRIGDRPTPNAGPRRRRAPAASKEAAAKNAALKKTFEEGVAASRAGNHDEAIAEFTDGGRAEPELLRLLLQHRASRSRRRRTTTRPKPRTRRRSSSRPTTPRPTAGSPTSTTRSASSTRPRRPARRRRS